MPFAPTSTQNFMYLIAAKTAVSNQPKKLNCYEVLIETNLSLLEQKLKQEQKNY